MKVSPSLGCLPSFYLTQTSWKCDVLIMRDVLVCSSGNPLSKMFADISKVTDTQVSLVLHCCCGSVRHVLSTQNLAPTGQFHFLRVNSILILCFINDLKESNSMQLLGLACEVHALAQSGTQSALTQGQLRQNDTTCHWCHWLFTLSNIFDKCCRCWVNFIVYCFIANVDFHDKIPCFIMSILTWKLWLFFLKFRPKTREKTKKLHSLIFVFLVVARKRFHRLATLN